MAQLSEHPSVRGFWARATASPSEPPSTLDAKELREVCLKAGADDIGFVDVDRAELAGERNDILSFFPHTKSQISFVRRMNREPIHNPARSVANVEFHQSGSALRSRNS
jgi:hypothetical protein